MIVMCMAGVHGTFLTSDDSPSKALAADVTAGFDMFNNGKPIYMLSVRTWLHCLATPWQRE